MEDLGYRALTAQNGPEARSIERAVSRFTDLVMPHGISGGEAGVGLFGKNVAGRGLPNVPQNCVRFSRGSTKLSEADAFRKRSPARSKAALEKNPVSLRDDPVIGCGPLPLSRPDRQLTLHAPSTPRV
jgi:hypothetical protein